MHTSVVLYSLESCALYFVRTMDSTPSVDKYTLHSEVAFVIRLDPNGIANFATGLPPYYVPSKPLEVREGYVCNMRHQYTVNEFFFAVISSRRKCSENLLPYVVTGVGSHNRSTNVPPKMVETGRTGRSSGMFERDAQVGP